MESINQFRQFVESLKFDWPNAIIVKDGIGRYIERIEDEHARLLHQAIGKAHADGERSAMKQIRSASVDYQKGYEAMKEECSEMRNFCQRLEEAAKKREDVTLFGVDYVALPVDAYGFAIRPGDVIDGYNCTSEVTSLKLTRDSVSQSWFIFTDDGCRWSDSYAFKHHKEPDVTDILREFALACEDAGNAGPEVERLAAEYAERLQIKGE